MSEPYITSGELRKIAELADVLNDSAFSELSVKATIFDMNGETIGYVRISECGEYAFHTDKEEDE